MAPLADCTGEPDPDLPRVGDTVQHVAFRWVANVLDIDEFGAVLVKRDRWPAFWIEATFVEPLPIDASVDDDDPF